MQPTWQTSDGSIRLFLGDCRDVMPALSGIDSCVTDPPYGLRFMGKAWDYDVPTSEAWELVLAALKPGAHLLSFFGTRTYHRGVVAIEDAGFEIRDQIGWLYGSGFPKSLDVSKAIDRQNGKPREVSGRGDAVDRTALDYGGATGKAKNGLKADWIDTEPITDEARQWNGWGTALKPAWEPVCVARKPLAGTVAANVLEHGTGGLNIDGCRIGTEDVSSSAVRKPGTQRFDGQNHRPHHDGAAVPTVHGSTCGRWPANIIHDGSEEVLAGFPAGSVNKAGVFAVEQGGGGGRGRYGQYGERDVFGYGDAGSAARFFYCAKASKRDREEGLDDMPFVHRSNGNKWTDQDYRVASGERPPSAESGPRKNIHPTVKPTALMRYLCRLVTPPDGLILDPYMGSGSTCKAAILEGFRFVGIEKDSHSFDIAVARIEAELAKQPLLEGVA